MKKNKTAKVMAILALLWIVISVVWTGILVFTSSNSNNQEAKQLTNKQIQDLLKQNKVNIKTLSWTKINK